MAQAPINVILQHVLLPGGTLTIPYPEGRNEWSFHAAVNHTLAIDSTFYRSPRDFVVVPQSDRLLFTWLGNFPIIAGKLLNLQMEDPYGEFYRDTKHGTLAMHTVTSPLFLVNFLTPDSADASYFSAPSKPTAGKPLQLAHDRNSTARNVVVYANSDASHCSFVIEGEDIYERRMVEHVQGPSDGGAEGKKAFARVTRIISDQNCDAEINVGNGNRLGIPVFLPGPAYVLREICNGESLQGGRIEHGETIFPPTAVSGDRRGTYTPPADALPNGKRNLQLLLSLVNPGHIGLFDYAG